MPDSSLTNAPRGVLTWPSTSRNTRNVLTNPARESDNRGKSGFFLQTRPTKDSGMNRVFTKYLFYPSSYFPPSLLPDQVLSATWTRTSILSLAHEHREPWFNQSRRWVASGSAPPWRLWGGQVVPATPAGRVEPLSSTLQNLENSSPSSKPEPYEGPLWMQPPREFCTSFLEHSPPPSEHLLSSTDRYIQWQLSPEATFRGWPRCIVSPSMTRERYFVPGKALKPHPHSEVGLGGGGNHASFRIKDPGQTAAFVTHTLKEEDFFCPTEKSENTALLLGVISMTVVANSSFLRCGQADLFSPLFPLSLLYFEMGGRENCEPSPYMSAICEHLFLGWHESQPLGTTLRAGPQPSLLSVKLWTKRTETHVLYRCAWETATRGYFTSSGW